MTVTAVHVYVILVDIPSTVPLFVFIVAVNCRKADSDKIWQDSWVWTLAPYSMHTA